VTARLAVPPCPSLVALTVLVPAASPVISPVPDTVAVSGALELQLTVRPLRTFPFASFSVAVNCCVPPTATLALPGLTLTEATGLGVPAAVVALATFDRLPNTASTFSVPRKAMSWKPYAVEADNPSTVHVRLVPIALPASGVAHVPRATAVAEPHEIGATANRTS